MSRFRNGSEHVAYTRVVEATHEFRVTVDAPARGVVVAAVTGDLDLATSPQFEQALRQARPGDRLVVDLSGCTFVDSSALRVLAARARASHEEGGAVAVVVSDPGVKRVLEIAALESMVELHELLDAAL